MPVWNEKLCKLRLLLQPLLHDLCQTRYSCFCSRCTFDGGSSETRVVLVFNILPVSAKFSRILPEVPPFLLGVCGIGCLRINKNLGCPFRIYATSIDGLLLDRLAREGQSNPCLGTNIRINVLNLWLQPRNNLDCGINISRKIEGGGCHFLLPALTRTASVSNDSNLFVFAKFDTIVPIRRVEHWTFEGLQTFDVGPLPVTDELTGSVNAENPTQSISRT